MAKTDTQLKPKRMGPPLGSQNHLKHGLRAGRLPKGCGYISTRVEKLREVIETQLCDQKGEVTITEAATINSMVRWERHALLAMRWLRQHVDDMTHDQRLAYSREIARASSERDKCLRSLKLDEFELEPHDWTTTLAATPLPDSKPTTTTNASAAT